MAAKSLTRSQKLSVLALLIGAAVAVAAWWFVPGAAWWVYTAGGLIVTVGTYRGLLEQKALETIVDDKPRR